MSEASFSPDYSEYEDLYNVSFYGLFLEVSDTSSLINASALIRFEAIGNIDTLVFELSSSIIVDSIFVNGQKTEAYYHTNNKIYIIPEYFLSANVDHRVKIFYYGGETKNGFFSGISNQTDFTYNVPVTYTLSEPFQALNWFPVKQKLTDKADSVRIEIVTDSTLLAGSNGLLKSVSRAGPGKIRYKWVSDYPVAYYLISVSVAKYRDLSFYVPLEDNDSLLIQNYIYDKSEVLENESENIYKTIELIKLFTNLFGEYPFINEKYGHCMAPIGGGMEHQTMTTIQSFNFDLVAHELAHQWFGNNVTCADWQNIWVNEGFASYGEYLAREFIYGKQAAAEWMSDAHSSAMKQKDGSIYLSDSEATNISRIFSMDLSYKKGAAILHMLRNEINNDSIFFFILRTFQDTFQDSVAVADDFLEIVNIITEEDFGYFFDQWYYGRGYPNLQATWDHKGDSLFIRTYQFSSGSSPDIFNFHTEIMVTNIFGDHTFFRIGIDKQENRFSMKYSDEIESIQMDPFHKTLMNASFTHSLPVNKIADITPNPFKDYIDLNFSNHNENKSIVINSLSGNEILILNLGIIDYYRLYLPELHPGIYLLRVYSGNNRFTKRIIKTD